MKAIYKYILLIVSTLSIVNSESISLSSGKNNWSESIYCKQISSLVDSLDENPKNQERKETQILQLYLEKNEEYIECIENLSIVDLGNETRFRRLNKVLAKQLISYYSQNKEIKKRNLLLNKIQGDFLYLAQNTNVTIELDMVCMLYGHTYRKALLAAQKHNEAIRFLSKKNLMTLLIKHRDYYIDILNTSKKHTDNRKKLMVKYFNQYFSELFNLLESGEDIEIFFDKINRNIESFPPVDIFGEGLDDSISKKFCLELMLDFRSISSILKWMK